jgi:hypothetical protein
MVCYTPSTTVHKRLCASKRLESELFTAAERFQGDFEVAQLTGSYSRIDTFRSRAGKPEMSDRVIEYGVMFLSVLQQNKVHITP